MFTASAAQGGPVVRDTRFRSHPDQKNDVLNIEKFSKIALPVSTHPDIPSVEFENPNQFLF